MNSTVHGLFGCLSSAKKLALPMLVLGAVAGARLGWVTTAAIHSNLVATTASGDPTSPGLPPNASEAVGRPGRNYDMVASGAAPQQATEAWLERWWMDVQESIKRAE